MNLKNRVFFGSDETGNFVFKLNCRFNFVKLLNKIISQFNTIRKKDDSNIFALVENCLRLF